MALNLAMGVWIRVLTVSAFGLWILWTVLLLVLSRIEFPLGNNKATQKSGRVISLVTLLFSFAAMVSIGSQMQFPVGESATLSYLISGLILVVLFLIGNLTFTMAPSRLLSNLKDLRNEIIFLRIEIDEALKRYEVLSEGETLPDAVQKELSAILGDLNMIEYAHMNMHRLLEQMMTELPRKRDTIETRERKAKQISLNKDSYFLHQAKCAEILKSLGAKLKQLNKKQMRVGGVTEDWANDNLIRTSLTQRLEVMDQVEAQLKQGILLIDYYLTNPDKMATELESSNDQPDSTSGP
jgi:hypothetical protein